MKSYNTMEDRILADKESIICTLGIKSMKFFESIDKNQERSSKMCKFT